MIEWLILGIFMFVMVCFLLGGLRIVLEWEDGVVLTLGKYSGIKSPGLTWICPGFQNLIRIDKRTRTIDMAPQEIISKDSVSISVDCVVYYKVVDPIKAVCQVEDFRLASYKMAQTALRDVVGQKQLDQILQEKDKIGIEVRKIVDDNTSKWGVQVSNIEIKDVTLPENMKRAMARESEATREKRARIIKSEAELEASKKFEQAANNMSAQAMLLRQLQTWQEIGTEHNSTMILIPTDLISGISNMMKKANK